MDNRSRRTGAPLAVFPQHSPVPNPQNACLYVTVLPLARVPPILVYRCEMSLSELSFLKTGSIAAALFIFAALPASAIVSLGPSSQPFGLTGIGDNGSGQGQSKVSWGSCAFDGTNTNCTLSGPFTGFGKGGTYSFVLTYGGNGAFPLIAVSQTPGNDFFYFQAIGNYALVITLAETNGPTNSFYSFANFNFLYSTPVCTGVPATSCRVGQVGLTPSSTISGPITGSFDPTPYITPANVISASGYGGFTSIAPSTWIEIYGANLGINLPPSLSRVWGTADFVGNQAPSSLNGTSVTVGGKPAYTLYVAPGQVNVQVPSDIATGTQPIVVTTAGGSSTPYLINVNAVEPGLLAIPSFVVNGRQNVVALFSNTLTYVFPNAIPGAKTARAKPGDTLTLYGIGFGPVTPPIAAGQVAQQASTLNAQVQISFAGVPAKLIYSGLGPLNVGLDQFNVIVPNVPASDTTPLTFTVDGVPVQQTLVIAIGN